MIKKLILRLVNYLTKKILKVPYIQYPVSFSTVDIGLICVKDGKKYVLLGRKPYRTEFQFPGGFRDPAETNERAAAREVKEETNLDINETSLVYIGNYVINDVRYINSCHKITTSFYYASIPKDMQFCPMDDLAELKLFEIDKIEEKDIHPIHWPLFQEFKKTIYARF